MGNEVYGDDDKPLTRADLNLSGSKNPIKPGEMSEAIQARVLLDKGLTGKMNIGPGQLFLTPPQSTYIDQNGVHFGDQGIGPATQDAKYILTILPDIMAKFLEKNVKYAEVEKGYDLGAAGIIPDLNRKLGILVARIWNHAPTAGEDNHEVIEDLIGHLLLMLAKMRDED